MESISRDGLLRGFQEEVVTERGSDRMIDRHRFDPLTGRNHTERTIVRDGRTRQLEFSIRTLAFTELRDWLLEAGFGEVHSLGRTGEALTLDDFRMVVIAGWS